MIKIPGIILQHSYKTSGTIDDIVHNSASTTALLQYCALFCENGPNAMKKDNILESYKDSNVQLDKIETCCFSLRLGFDTAENRPWKNP